MSCSFSEGQGLGIGGEPKLVKQPDDDPTAISDVCLLLHGEEVGSLSSTATSKRILSYAIAVEKYHCLKALRLYSQRMLFAWLDRNPGQTESRRPRIENRWTFSLTTEKLMQQWNRPLYL